MNHPLPWIPPSSNERRSTGTVPLAVGAKGHDEELGGQDQSGDARLLKLGGRTCIHKVD